MCDGPLLSYMLELTHVCRLPPLPLLSYSTPVVIVIIRFCGLKRIVQWKFCLVYRRAEYEENKVFFARLSLRISMQLSYAL